MSARANAATSLGCCYQSTRELVSRETLTVLTAMGFLCLGRLELRRKVCRLLPSCFGTCRSCTVCIPYFVDHGKRVAGSSATRAAAATSLRDGEDAGVGAAFV